LGKLEVTEGVTVEYEGSNIRVTIPKLSNWEDEYLRKSGQGQDKVAQKRERRTQVSLSLRVFH
jgi:hypothetical protein